MPDSLVDNTEHIPLSLLEFLAWVDARPRTYSETMEAWRSSCPRLSVWEDAIGNELVRIDATEASAQCRADVRLTTCGLGLLRKARPSAS